MAMVGMSGARWFFPVFASIALGINFAQAGEPDAAPANIPEHQQIEGPFADGIDVTGTCLECHEDAALDLMQTTHWTWSTKQLVYGRGLTDTGKRHAVNNFCYGVASNLSKCTECHVGYGWKDDSFDFRQPSNVDCLICHDTTGSYRRLGGDGGVADPATDFEYVARNVGTPGRANCGACHFYAGSAHAVKHGDLEAALIEADESIDVHMAVNGLDFACQSCHVTEAHRIPGTTMAASPAGTSVVACTDCHSGAVHAKETLERHARSVACQTCHIPHFAKGEPTKVYWDWSAAGKGKEAEYTEEGLAAYVPYKGRFVWARNVIPEYAWFAGKAGVHAWGDKIDPEKELQLNWPVGAKQDETAKIYPFKVHRGRQIYDSGHKYLVNPHLVSADGFAYTLDWDTAAELGMKARGLDYSGQYDFVDTLMYLRINHMVAPASQALECRDCHGKDQKRMKWQELGYDADPLYVAGQARRPITR